MVWASNAVTVVAVVGMTVVVDVKSEETVVGVDELGRLVGVALFGGGWLE